MVNIPQSLPTDGSFHNPYNISMWATRVSIFVVVIGLVFLLKLYFITKIVIHRFIVNTLVFIILIIGMVIAIGVTESIGENVSNELLTKQHIWAESRYGILYDEITTYRTDGKVPTTYQEKVMSNGEVIAEVCSGQRGKVLFCKPDTFRELPVIKR